MPVFFLVIGLLLIVTVVRGTTADFAKRLGQDVSGGYLKWLAAIIVIGALGFVPSLKLPSRYLLALVALVVMLRSGSGFISQLASQLSSPGTVTPTTQPGGNANLPAIPVQTQGGAGAGAGAPGGAGGLGSTAGSVLGGMTGVPGGSAIGSALGGLFGR